MMLSWFFLLLICPLMMIFMMKGMHGSDKNNHSIDKKELNELKEQNEHLAQELSKLKSELK